MQVRPLKLPCWARLVGTQDVVSIPVSHTFMCMHICECTFSKIASILGMAQLTWWCSSRLSEGRIVEFDTLSMWVDLVYLYSLLLLSLVTLDIAVDTMFRFVFVRNWLIMPRMLRNRRKGRQQQNHNDLSTSIPVHQLLLCSSLHISVVWVN